MSDDSTTRPQDVQPGSVVEAPAGLTRENRDTIEVSEVFRDFDQMRLERRNGDDRPQITYKLQGNKMRCVNPIPTGQMLQALRRAIKQGFDDVPVTQSADILESWTIPEDRDKLNDTLDRLEEWADVGRVLWYIMEKAAGFPTAESTSSDSS